MKASRQPEQCLPAFVAKVNFAASWVGEADPLWFMRRGNPRHVLLALHMSGADLEQFGTGGDPKSCWLVSQNGVWREAISEALPVAREDLVQSAVAAVQVFVKRGKVRPEVLACASRPH